MARNPQIKQKEPRKSTIEFGSNVDAALKSAVNNALRNHKRAGIPVAVWRNGKVVLLQPEEILP